MNSVPRSAHHYRFSAAAVPPVRVAPGTRLVFETLDCFSNQLTSDQQHYASEAELMDLIGLDVNLATTESVYARTDAKRLAPVDLQRRMVAEGLLGRKTGAGRTTPRARQPVHITPPVCPAVPPAVPSDPGHPARDGPAVPGGFT